MDQHELYQLSAASSVSTRDMSPALVARDDFVVRHISKFLGGNKSSRIAELSVGDGRMTLAMLAALPKATLTCAEISASRIDALRDEICRSPSLRMPEFLVCNLDTDFSEIPNDAFDAVVALDIMEHVLDVFSFISHCQRVLKPGAWLYLRVPNIAYLKHRLNLLRGRMPVTSSWFGLSGDLSAWRHQHGWDGGHLHLFTIPILRQLLREAGLVVESCDDAGASHPRLRKVWPNLLFANPLLIARKN